MYSIGNIVNNILITLHGDRWKLGLYSDRFVMYKNIKSLCCTPEINVNYTSIKKRKKIVIKVF